MESHQRTLAKTLTFRFVATIVTMVLVLVFTGDLSLMGTIGVLDVLTKLALYYFHERIWGLVSWGKATK